MTPATEAKARPIIFSGDMVRAINSGKKTQTRRIVTPQPVWLGEPLNIPHSDEWCDGAGSPFIRCPYGRVGDRLDVVELRPFASSPNDDYLAGSDGQIYSRTAYKGFGRKEYCDWYPLVGYRNEKGYDLVSLSHQSKKVVKHVHFLVCEAFYGPRPSPSHQTRHREGVWNGNAASNLCWGTQQENWLDRKAHGNGVEGEKHPQSKLTDIEREHVRWAINKGLTSQRHAAKALGLSQAAISGLMHGAEIEDTPKRELPEAYQRLTLEITDVRVERLQDISEADVIAEGFAERDGYPLADCVAGWHEPFAAKWESINGKKRGCRWEDSPWVWVIGFSRISAAPAGEDQR